jgi:hypothetical protein
MSCFDFTCKQPAPYHILKLRACIEHYIEAIEHGGDFLMPRSDTKLIQLIAEEKKSREQANSRSLNLRSTLGDDSILVDMPTPNKVLDRPPVL